jgi:hypothetical protein
MVNVPGSRWYGTDAARCWELTLQVLGTDAAQCWTCRLQRAGYRWFSEPALPPRAQSLAVRGERVAWHRDGRGASRARRDDREYRESPGVFKGGATQPARMHRPSNAARLSPRAAASKACGEDKDKVQCGRSCCPAGRAALHQEERLSGSGLWAFGAGFPPRGRAQSRRPKARLFTQSPAGRVPTATRCRRDDGPAALRCLTACPHGGAAWRCRWQRRRTIRSGRWSTTSAPGLASNDARDQNVQTPHR